LEDEGFVDLSSITYDNRIADSIENGFVSFGFSPTKSRIVNLELASKGSGAGFDPARFVILLDLHAE